MLTLILAEAELELVPDAIKDHSQVRAAARARDRRPSRTILDASLHHDAMRPLTESERRGRPDLTHFGMLLALDSALNQNDGLRLVVHTRNDERLAVNPETRLMRHYPRFIGLMEKLFHDMGTPRAQENPFLLLESGWPLSKVLEHHASGPIVCFSEKGRPVEPGAYLAEKAAANPDLTIVLGAFPHGDFHIEPSTWASDVVSLGGDALSVWTVEMEVLAHWERAKGVFPRQPPTPEPTTPPTP